YLTPYGRFVAVLMPAPAKNITLRADQYRAFSDPARALELSREVVRAKITNQRPLLMRSLRYRPDADPSQPSRARAEPARPALTAACTTRPPRHAGKRPPASTASPRAHPPWRSRGRQPPPSSAIAAARPALPPPAAPSPSAAPTAALLPTL